MLTGVQVFPSKHRFRFHWVSSQGGFDRLCACSFPNLLRKLHTVFHNSCTTYIATNSAQVLPVLCIVCVCERAPACWETGKGEWSDQHRPGNRTVSYTFPSMSLCTADRRGVAGPLILRTIFPDITGLDVSCQVVSRDPSLARLP